MPIPFPSAGPASHHREDELRWSKSERAIARKTFDHALNQELQEVMQRAKRWLPRSRSPRTMGAGATSDPAP